LRRLLNHPPPEPQQFPQLAELRRRHEARPDQAVAQQLAQPLGILDVGLAPRHVADVLGVADNDLDVPFQNRVDRLPEHPGALHRDMAHAAFPQPVAQRFKIRRHRAEGPELLAAPPARLADQDAAHHGLLMNIQTGPALMQNVHRHLLPQEGDRDAARKSRHCPACWPTSAATFDDPSKRRGPNLPSGVRATSELPVSARSP
jgi:hypothetical protein